MKTATLYNRAAHVVMDGSLLFFSFLWWEIFHSLRKRSAVPIPTERIANFGDHLTFSSPSPTTFDDWQDKCATREEIHAVIDALVEVCRKYKSCGFDGMSFRCDRYLDANTNIRQDEYCGDVVDRGIFLLELFEKVKTKVGKLLECFSEKSVGKNLYKGILRYETGI